MALAIDAIICDRPFVAPSDRLFGTEAVINMKMVPTEEVSLSGDSLPYAISMKASITRSVAIRNHTAGEFFPLLLAIRLVTGTCEKNGGKRGDGRSGDPLLTKVPHYASEVESL